MRPRTGIATSVWHHSVPPDTFGTKLRTTRDQVPSPVYSRGRGATRNAPSRVPPRHFKPSRLARSPHTIYAQSEDVPVAAQREVLFVSDTIDIYHDDRGWLYVDWKGQQSVESVKAGCEQMLLHLRELGLSKVLNDNTHVAGSWSCASRWWAVDWLPCL